MCGIVGIVNLDGLDINIKILLKMQNAVLHRGPDGSGQHVSNNVGFAMRRLSIIDVKGGGQPLYNEDKSISIVGNGEIYNYLELQKELKTKGHKLRTGSDIETAIHAYEEWGPNCVKRFRGQFALAIHDKNKKRVLLYRERIGEKPIYFTKVGKSFYFASELKALINIPKFDNSLDLKAIDLYFHYYYIPEPLTPFKDTKKLQAGSFIEINLKKGSFKESLYWDPIGIKPTDDSDPTDKIKKVFETACTLTFRSDVPVGISLSGGIDSGAILAFSAPKFKSVMNAFSIGYEGTPPSDERKMAKELARKFKVNFIEKEIKVSEIVNHFPQLVWSCDDPIADIAAHSIYEVSKLARKHKVKVLLGGIGGDEIFWGYPSSVEAVKQNIKNKKGFSRFLNRKFVYNNPNPSSTGLIITKLYSDKFKEKVGRNNYGSVLDNLKLNSRLNIAITYLDRLRELWLKSNVITLGDRMSMAASVELRSPFLDYKLIELVLSSKKCVEAYELDQKHYFKEAMKGILPEEVTNRPKKGFTPPVGQWISGLIKRYSHLLRNGFLVQYGILDDKKTSLASTLFKNIPTYTLYQLLVMEIWGREFVMGERPKDLQA